MIKKTTKKLIIKENDRELSEKIRKFARIIEEREAKAKEEKKCDCE